MFDRLSEFTTTQSQMSFHSDVSSSTSTIKSEKPQPRYASATKSQRAKHEDDDNVSSWNSSLRSYSPMQMIERKQKVIYDADERPQFFDIK